MTQPGPAVEKLEQIVERIEKVIHSKNTTARIIGLGAVVGLAVIASQGIQITLIIGG